jgi:hypothetical protein
MYKKVIIASLVTGTWGSLSSLISLDNIRHTETLWWFSGSLFEKAVLLPAYLTNLAGNPFMPTSQGESIIITPFQAKVWHIVISTLIGVLIGVGIAMVINKHKEK